MRNKRTVDALSSDSSSQPSSSANEQLPKRRRFELAIQPSQLAVPMESDSERSSAATQYEVEAIRGTCVDECNFVSLLSRA